MTEVDLPIDSQKRLIALARRTLEAVLRGSSHSYVPIDDPVLARVGYGAFVTLFDQEELRGCIGTCTPVEPLGELVARMTEASATRDPRMRPVSAAELGRIWIDISVLSPLEPNDDPLALQVGKHGLHISRGRKRGVLLPQVATEYGWDMATFLEQTCLKADLPIDAWRRNDTVVSSFTALVIKEAK